MHTQNKVVEFPFYTKLMVQGQECFASAACINLSKIPFVTFIQSFYYVLPTGEYVKCVEIPSRHPEIADQYHADLMTFLA